MVLTQISMVAIMTMTPVHMRAHHHDPADVGLVIGLHIGAMFLPSLVTALVVDATVPANRPQLQGKIDVLVAVAGSSSSRPSKTAARRN